MIEEDEDMARAAPPPPVFVVVIFIELINNLELRGFENYYFNLSFLSFTDSFSIVVLGSEFL